jgi:hypothetical protein
MIAMDRRAFIGRLAAGIAGFTILPGAGRVWRATRSPVIVRVPVIPAHWDLVSLQKVIFELARRREREGNANHIEIFTDSETARILGNRFGRIAGAP